MISCQTDVDDIFNNFVYLLFFDKFDDTAVSAEKNEGIWFILYKGQKPMFCHILKMRK